MPSLQFALILVLLEIFALYLVNSFHTNHLYHCISELVPFCVWSPFIIRSTLGVNAFCHLSFGMYFVCYNLKSRITFNSTKLPGIIQTDTQRQLVYEY